MFAFIRWWERHWLAIALAIAALGATWVSRQTQSSLVFDLYALLSRPFQTDTEAAEQRLTNARIEELQARIVELQSQNQKLKQHLEYTQQNQIKREKMVPIVGRSPDNWWQQLVLGSGSQDGIKPGYVVVGPGGLVGRVTQVTNRTSRVLLLSDPESQVGVKISRSGYAGLIRGQGSQQVVMEFFDQMPDVKVGDVVTTSTYSVLYPAGLPVGTVKSISPNKSPAPEAVVELSVPLDHLEWVFVSPHEAVVEQPEQNPTRKEKPVPGEPKP
ncbi:rod shape-determining protein MreC [Geitlerinema sp. PCC 9228]|jgi:rod shape-determining protein MreC|uniref:rod shape-determining protein MreC n=1 Tax=Geitlerinema sp. PCC 9228 TaxID=111611 RepID=UPI0008F999D8|nr:rod shape-determining protein MreC [Geitlerinema sp. PCC 9228]